MIQTQALDYQAGEAKLEAFLAFDDAIKKKRPCVLIAHAWAGRDAFVCEKAKRLAELGYVGVALDVYGKGILGKDKESNAKLMTPLLNDRLLLQKRLLAGFEAAKQFAIVETGQIGAIGYCFGGLCALDLARSGIDLKGVVSFHGLLHSDERIPKKKIRAKVLAMHGHDDPMVTADRVSTFEKEMTDAEVDWQLLIFGKTLHAFTNPEANDPGFGTVYNALADKRSWIYMKDFFKEIFA